MWGGSARGERVTVSGDQHAHETQENNTRVLGIEKSKRCERATCAMTSLSPPAQTVTTVSPLGEELMDESRTSEPGVHLDYSLVEEFLNEEVSRTEEAQSAKSQTAPTKMTVEEQSDTTSTGRSKRRLRVVRKRSLLPNKETTSIGLEKILLVLDTNEDRERVRAVRSQRGAAFDASPAPRNVRLQHDSQHGLQHATQQGAPHN